jgi:hypothetical protein
MSAAADFAYFVLCNQREEDPFRQEEASVAEGVERAAEPPWPQSGGGVSAFQEEAEDSPSEVVIPAHARAARPPKVIQSDVVRDWAVSYAVSGFPRARE